MDFGFKEYEEHNWKKNFGLETNIVTKMNSMHVCEKKYTSKELIDTYKGLPLLRKLSFDFNLGHIDIFSMLMKFIKDSDNQIQQVKYSLKVIGNTGTLFTNLRLFLSNSCFLSGVNSTKIHLRWNSIAVYDDVAFEYLRPHFERISAIFKEVHPNGRQLQISFDSSSRIHLKLCPVATFNVLLPIDLLRYLGESFESCLPTSLEYRLPGMKPGAFKTYGPNILKSHRFLDLTGSTYRTHIIHLDIVPGRSMNWLMVKRTSFKIQLRISADIFKRIFGVKKRKLLNTVLWSGIFIFDIWVYRLKHSSFKLLALKCLREVPDKVSNIIYSIDSFNASLEMVNLANYLRYLMKSGRIKNLQDNNT